MVKALLSYVHIACSVTVSLQCFPTDKFTLHSKRSNSLAMFSRRTYSDLASLLKNRSAARLTVLFHRFSLDKQDPGGNITGRAVALVQAVENGQSPEGSVEEVTFELLAEVVDQLDSDTSEVESLRRSLAADGFAYANNRLVPIIPAPFADPMQPAKVMWMLESLAASVAANHFRQAVDAFAEGKYEAANSQGRTTLESLLNFLSEKAGKHTTDGPTALQALRSSGKIDDKENALLKAVWGILHFAGSHPGMSTRDQSLLRLTSTCLAIWLLAGKYGVVAT